MMATRGRFGVAGGEKSAEAANYASVVDIGSATHVACAFQAVRQVHTCVDGCREIEFFTPFAKGARLGIFPETGTQEEIEVLGVYADSGDVF